MKPVSLTQALKRLPMDIYQHGALGYAKGASYSALLSFFPVFAVTTACLLYTSSPVRLASRRPAPRCTGHS